MGFVSVKGIGSEVGSFIEHEREANGPYKGLGDFLRRTQTYTNKRTLESLVKS